MVGLYASFTIAVTIAFVGGRPGMISAATGAMALLMINLVQEHGLVIGSVSHKVAKRANCPVLIVK